ncbi:MAG: ATP-binding protein, partial [Cellvibrionaceae bacterium]|nr:ATP-binding protein [Cellvibrionaceae bacterium]
QALHPLLDKLQAERFELDVDIANTLPKIVADPDMLVVLLSNLLENAYKYSAEKKYIKLSVYCEGQTLTFAVSDHGIGLSPSDCQKVFDGFYRVKTEAQHNTQGCGLGLNIAKYIVENHQGSISASSELGQGTTFTVKLPLHQGATT